MERRGQEEPPLEEDHEEEGDLEGSDMSDEDFCTVGIMETPCLGSSPCSVTYLFND